MKHIILENKARCLKCDDVVESMYRHDFVTCKCGEVSVDGGKDYMKRSVGLKGYEDLSVVIHEWETSDFEDDSSNDGSNPEG